MPFDEDLPDAQQKGPLGEADAECGKESELEEHGMI
jgi:hypothetical protein